MADKDIVTEIGDGIAENVIEFGDALLGLFVASPETEEKSCTCTCKCTCK